MSDVERCDDLPLFPPKAQGKSPPEFKVTVGNKMNDFRDCIVKPKFL